MSKKKRRELRETDERFERRYFDVSELRVVRSDDEDEPVKIIGHAAVFDQWSEDLGGFREKIRPGAFRKSIGHDDIRCLWNHNSDYVLGRNKISKTLVLDEDERGLAIECTPPDTQYARDFLMSIERGDVNQMSFGFYTIKDEWEYVSDEDWKAGGLDERELIECELFDVSPVTYPAYPQTDVALRTMERHHDAEDPGEPPVPDDSESQCDNLSLVRASLEIRKRKP